MKTGAEYRFGRYHVDRLIERYGIDAKLFDFEPKADCPRKIARNDYDPCRGLRTRSGCCES